MKFDNQNRQSRSRGFSRLQPPEGSTPASYYRFDLHTGEEQFRRLRLLEDGQHAIPFNTRKTTGVKENIVVQSTGHILRENGEEHVLSDPATPRVRDPHTNALSVREIFLHGTSGRVLCIRRLPRDVVPLPEQLPAAEHRYRVPAAA